MLVEIDIWTLIKMFGCVTVIFIAVSATLPALKKGHRPHR